MKIQAVMDIEAELEKADLARLSGNEGRARVCARRAAGIAARAFLTRHGVGLHDMSSPPSPRTCGLLPHI
jgi:hypothetical protein